MGLSLKLLHDRKQIIRSPLDKAPIVIRITINRKSFFINTDVKIIQKHWDSKKFKISSTCPDWMKLNKIIQNKIEKINLYYNDCLLDGKIPNRKR
ncbi:Arm DNA-binding domain-containing protein [Flavobacteriales bacterium]|nr:Arm DNA-binding domain-containing protein [Flavobacteriales bacterium]